MVRSFILIFGLFVAAFGHAMMPSQKHVFGYVENVYLPELKTAIKAKLDTGAKSSSLSAVNIEKSSEKGETYVTFTIPLEAGNITLKKQVIRTTKIKKRKSEVTLGEKPSFPRPVIHLTIQVGGQEREIEVNLADRRRFNYPLLLGRNALIKIDSLIDPAKVFLSKHNPK